MKFNQHVVTANKNKYSDIYESTITETELIQIRNDELTAWNEQKLLSESLKVFNVNLL